MTPLPQTVGTTQTSGEALREMRALGVHHLPVTEGDKLVGLVSERHLTLVGGDGTRDDAARPVAEVMVPEPFAVGPETPLTTVVRTMASRRAECCVVIEDGRVVGILTTGDAMHLLGDLLAARVDLQGHGLLPSEVRRRILQEHKMLREMCNEIESTAKRVREGDEEAAGKLREASRTLYQTLLRHITLENTILAPTLRETDAFGPDRADGLLREHERQRDVLFGALAAVDRITARQIADEITGLVADLRRDMKHEEQDLLSSELLKDDPITTNTFTG